MQRDFRKESTYEEVVSILKELKQSKVKVIYDIDDNFLDSHPVKEAERCIEPIRSKVYALLRRADLVVTTNSFLERRISKLCKATFVIPNMIPEDWVSWDQRSAIGDLLR